MADYVSQFTGAEIDSRLRKAGTAVQPADLESKQDTLVSGENIKTVNGQSIVGSGNMQIQAGDTDAVKYVEQTLTDAQKTQARTNIAAASAAELGQIVTALSGIEADIDSLETAVAAINNGDYITATTLPTASASTMGHIYLIGPDANNNYDRYFTQESGGAYSWVSLGSTQIDLSTYATEEEVSQLRQEVDDLSTGKYYGYFAKEEDLPEADVDGFAYVGEGPTYTIYNLRGGVWTSSEITVNQSPIGNDEDIDQDEDGKLQFANRVYNSQQPNGMGYVILRKNKTFMEQVTDTNTIYEIRYDFNLGGATVTIPAGCVLKFDGGKISNGSIIGNGTQIEGSKVVLFESVEIGGSWIVADIYSRWFSDNTISCLKNISKLCDENIQNNIIIDDGEYSVAFSQNGDTALAIPSNTKLGLSATIKVVANSYDSYSVISLYRVSNIEIYGGGTVIGDKDTHTGTTGEFGFGIRLNGCRNVKIENLSIDKCWGDSIVVGGESVNTDISINNIRMHDSRRQGISVTFSNGVIIENCEIDGISGTSPQSGIDIEPISQYSQYVKNVVIKNTEITNCNGNGILITSDAGDNVEAVNVSNCTVSGNLGDSQVKIFQAKNVSFVDCILSGVETNDVIINNKGTGLSFRCCTISGKVAINENFADELYKVDLIGCYLTSSILAKRCNFYNCTLVGAARVLNSNIISSIVELSGANSPEGWTPLGLYGVSFIGGKLVYASSSPSTYLIEISASLVVGVAFTTKDSTINWSNVTYLFSPSGGVTKTYIDISCDGKPANLSVNNANIFVRNNGVISGNHQYKPAAAYLDLLKSTGLQYFDTALNKPIWWNGTTWVDASGTAITD